MKKLWDISFDIYWLLKKILRKRRDLRLIVSSATVDAEYIRDFFGGKTGVLSVHGTAYSVEVFYLEKPCPDYVKGRENFNAIPLYIKFSKNNLKSLSNFCPSFENGHWKWVK